MSAADLSGTEEADMTECDGDKVVTMMDVLQEQEDFEEDANAVLGASDEKNCTYPKGYIKRQALYACLTCCPDAKTDPTKRAGVCLACSLSCHESHELVELYTKRNFCCDCGNPKFNSHPCQFTSNKTDLNENNNYNQNFSGLYCVCHRPYPDPEATFEDEMIQCVICEDWLHSSHLEAKVPPNEQYSEMICKACMEKNKFLHDYSDLAVNVESEDVDVIDTEKVNGVCNCDTKENGDVDMAEDTEKKSAEKKTDDVSDNKNNDSETESTEKPDASMEVEPEQNLNENSEVLKQNDEQKDVSEKTPDTKKDETTEEAAGDSTVESKTEEAITNPTTDKLEEQSGDSLDKKSTEEQNNSITDSSNLDNKTVNDNSESESASETTQDAGSETETKEEGNSQSEIGEKPESKPDSAEGIEKDDLLESIDRIINGDDEKSGEPEKNDSAAEQKSTDENNKTDGSTSEENKEKFDDADKKETTAVNGEDNKENKSQTDNDMVETKNGDSTNEADIEQSNDHKRKFEEDENDKGDVKKPKLEDTKGCIRPKGVKKHLTGATFWPGNFRQKLCTCNECITMYKDLSVLFLIDLEDTVSAYETLGKEKNDGRSSQYEIGLQALSSLDRIQQINALTEYNKMRDKLLDFLKSFKDRKEVVKEEDIKAFFAGMKPKREPDGVYFCR